MNSRAKCILMRPAESCHPEAAPKARRLGWQESCKPSKSGKSCTWLGGNNSICTSVQVPVFVDLKEDKLLDILTTVKVNHTWGCTSQDVAMGLRKGTLPFSPALECWKYHAWLCPSVVQDTNKLQPVQWRAAKVVKGLEDAPYRDWGHWDYLAWRREGFDGIFSYL